ncbi:HEAT repeat domain-containing protein [Streptomyces tritici]|uniref:HEAT repeat domain-containing protein n=1 Tax=Streptomyces tritici TaxID=2054410 RepID=UPI003AEFDF05
MSAYDWSRVFHAYGPATDTGELLRGPLADARDHLWSDVLHHGRIWPATPQALRVVAGRLPEAPLFGLEFVRAVASAANFGTEAEKWRARVAAAPTREWTEEYLARDEDGRVGLWDDPTGNLVLVGAALECWDGLPELLEPVAEYLDDPDGRVRVQAWATLTRLVNHPEAAARTRDLLPRLTRLAAAAESVRERASLVMDLGQLGGDLAPFLADPSPLVRCAAAMSPPLAEDPAAHEELLRTAAAPTEFDALEGLPRFEGEPPRWTLIAVLSRRPVDPSRLYEPALASLPHAFRTAPCPDLGPYLEVLFGDGWPQEPVPEQRGLARALASRDELWAPTNGNRKITLRGLNLPDDREAWRAVGGTA